MTTTLQLPIPSIVHGARIVDMADALGLTRMDALVWWSYVAGEADKPNPTTCSACGEWFEALELHAGRCAECVGSTWQ